MRAMLPGAVGFLFLVPAVVSAADKGVAINAGKTEIEFRAGDTVVAKYQIGPSVAKPYFFPIIAPGGAAVTRGWPMTDADPGEPKDHVHQKSVWFCHGDVIPEGVQLAQKIKGVDGVDFWSEAVGHGKIVCTEVDKPQINGKDGKIVTFNEWRTADGVKILNESRTIHFHDLGDAYLFVLDIDLHATACPITFGDTKEGSMGVRVRDSMTEKNKKGKLTLPGDRETEKNVWGHRGDWCDYSGPAPTKDGKETIAGIAIFDHPKNPYRACWHSRGYGLMAANPFGRKKAAFPDVKNETELVKMAKGDHLKLRYGILLHAGDVKAGKVAEIYEKFVNMAAN